MKRTIIALLLSAFLSVSSQAQKPFNPLPKSGYHGSQTIQTATDTLFGNFFIGTPALYQAQSVFPGYASGNNSFGDRAKAQVFSVDSVCAVEGAIIWMGYKKYTSNNVNSKVNFNLFGLKSSVTGQGSLALKLCPDSIFRSASINMADIDTSSVFENGINLVTFNAPAYFDSLFAIGFDFAGLVQGDSIACYTNTNGDADSTENSWEMAVDSTWGTMLNNWNLDVDFAIFPIIDGTQTGLSNQINNLPVIEIYPNPASSYITISSVNSSSLRDLNVSVVNSQGQLITNQKITAFPQVINISTLCNGLYYIIVRDVNNIGYAQKLIIE